MLSSYGYDSLYLHVPFCKNICDYCKLYSVVENSESKRQQYLEKIKNDLNNARESLSSIKTIFIGGGTPSSLYTHEMRDLLNECQNFPKLDEFTMECNPSSVTLEKLTIMRDFGVNRLSFGGQSTSRKTRKILGRRTGDKELFKALELAFNTGFKNVNVDLIYGVPGQSLADWQYDVETVMDLGVKHFSAYSLILEEGARISERIHETDDDLAVEMYHLCQSVLNQYGLERYEVSNYASPGFECKHNLGIWHGAKYLGIGPAAASFDGFLRWTEIDDLEAWISGQKAEKDEIPQIERAAEVFAFGFRTRMGWQKKRLHSLYGIDILNEFKEILDQLMKQGLLEQNQNHIFASDHGLLFADEIAELIIGFSQEYTTR